MVRFYRVIYKVVIREMDDGSARAKEIYELIHLICGRKVSILTTICFSDDWAEKYEVIGLLFW